MSAPLSLGIHRSVLDSHIYRGAIPCDSSVTVGSSETQRTIVWDCTEYSYGVSSVQDILSSSVQFSQSSLFRRLNSFNRIPVRYRLVKRYLLHIHIQAYTTVLASKPSTIDTTDFQVFQHSLLNNPLIRTAQV